LQPIFFGLQPILFHGFNPAPDLTPCKADLWRNDGPRMLLGKGGNKGGKVGMD
jgi:hypothetical protein